MFPDMTLAPAQILVNAINVADASTLPRPIVLADVVFADPYAYGGDTANTKIPVAAVDKVVFGAGDVEFTYSRVDVSKLINTVLHPLSTKKNDGTNVVNVSDVLEQLNPQYGINLKATDIVDAPATTTGKAPSAILVITKANLIYCNNVILTWPSTVAAPVAMDSAIKVTEQASPV